MVKGLMEACNSLTLILSFFKLILKHSHYDRVQEMHG